MHLILFGKKYFIFDSIGEKKRRKTLFKEKRLDLCWNVMTKVSIFGESFLKNQDVMISSVVANGHIGMPHVMHHHPYDLEDNFLQILGKNSCFFFQFEDLCYSLFVFGNQINIGHSLLFCLSNLERKDSSLWIVEKH